MTALGAGVVHVAVAPEHTNWAASVAFFLALGLFQIVWGAATIAGKLRRSALLVGAAVQVGAMATWAVSRTSGMPFGPHRGVADPAARADILATVLGVMSAAAAIALAVGISLRGIALARRAAASGLSGLAASALAIVALTGVSGHGHELGDDHVHTVAVEEAAPATPQSAPAETPARCRRIARVASDADLAKALQKAQGELAAIAKAEKAAAKRLKRALKACGEIRPATPPQS